MAYAPESGVAQSAASWADNVTRLGGDGSADHAGANLSGGAGLGAPQPNPQAGQRDYGDQAGDTAAAGQTNVIGTVAPGNGVDIDAWPPDAQRVANTFVVQSWTEPLVAERARGVDGAGGHPHARVRVQTYSRPWEFDHGGGWGDVGRLGLHVLEVPGVQEPAGYGPGTITLPQPLTTRVPPPRWDEVYRYAPDGSYGAAADASSSGL
ncbi:MAG TPA: hypothetical protein VFC99_05705 [Acidimicrobiia bacterium]|nr:hypothetical protein [Acidimicrobiia bacterium]